MFPIALEFSKIHNWMAILRVDSGTKLRGTKHGDQWSHMGPALIIGWRLSCSECFPRRWASPSHILIPLVWGQHGQWYFCLFVSLLGIEPRAFHVLGTCSRLNYIPRPFYFLFWDRVLQTSQPGLGGPPIACAWLELSVLSPQPPKQLLACSISTGVFKQFSHIFWLSFPHFCLSQQDPCTQDCKLSSNERDTGEVSS